MLVDLDRQYHLFNPALRRSRRCVRHLHLVRPRGGVPQGDAGFEGLADAAVLQGETARKGGLSRSKAVPFFSKTAPLLAVPPRAGRSRSMAPRSFAPVRRSTILFMSLSLILLLIL